MEANNRETAADLTKESAGSREATLPEEATRIQPGEVDLTKSQDSLFGNEAAEAGKAQVGRGRAGLSWISKRFLLLAQHGPPRMRTYSSGRRL